MRRYLVVANRTLGGEHLLEVVRECLAAGPCEFHVVVPASDPPHSLVPSEREAIDYAKANLDAVLRSFRALGVTVDGEVGDRRPTDAIADALRDGAFDEIILSTLPPGPSAWLRQDLPHRVERQFDLPVRHVIGAAEAVSSG